MQIKDLIIKTEKVNWMELKELQPENLKSPFYSEHTKSSLIKNGFAFTFYVWQDTNGDIFIIDGHLRKDLLIELKNDGYNVPNELNCTFLDLADKKQAIKYLLEVFNTKKNPIGESEVIDWLETEEIDKEEVAFDWLNMQTEIKPDDLGTDFTLPDGDKEPFQQMTFILADEQANILKQMIDEAKKEEGYKYCETFGNENSNGNALYYLVRKLYGES